ncbi:hypothetical protein KR51_00004200 [Rubidibacter lacunae KORDI 51-2]|uniref:Uncharacterized protein n=1 Tax=Rubidibacter lacunae KORDI 51-2 TaxID=582515 RepID=U5DE69_9CHRO|nr:hypothetical protein KR51_00004200 [Rubidibacter lacunae KORDI 51-2]
MSCFPPRKLFTYDGRSLPASFRADSRSGSIVRIVPSRSGRGISEGGRMSGVVSAARIAGREQNRAFLVVVNSHLWKCWQEFGTLREAKDRALRMLS